MALTSGMALAPPSVAFNPLQVDYGKVHVGHTGNPVLIAERVESAFDEEFFDAMTNVFGDDRAVSLPRF